MAILRVVSFIILFLSVISAPWPFAAGLAAIFMAVFSWFWEAVPIGFLLGGIYAFSKGESGFLFAFFASSFLMVLIFEEYFKRFIQGRNIVSHALTAVFGGALFVLLWLVFKLTLHA